MSYEHCEMHDEDATNGCESCERGPTMTDKKITVELTVAQAEHLEFRTRLGTNLVVPDGMDEGLHVALDDALTAHREEQERASLGTPWAYKQGRADQGAKWYVTHVCTGRILAGVGNRGPELTEAQARLMAAAPELADALGLWVAWSAERHYSELEDCIGAANAALRKSGMLK